MKSNNLVLKITCHLCILTIHCKCSKEALSRMCRFWYSTYTSRIWFMQLHFRSWYLAKKVFVSKNIGNIIYFYYKYCCLFAKTQLSTCICEICLRGFHVAQLIIHIPGHKTNPFSTITHAFTTSYQLKNCSFGCTKFVEVVFVISKQLCSW